MIEWVLGQDLVEAPPPVGVGVHPINPLAPDVGCQDRPEPVPPEPHYPLAIVDPTLVGQVLDTAKGRGNSKHILTTMRMISAKALKR